MIKAVCFDLNKTLISENTWLNLNLKMGMTQVEDDVLFGFHQEGVITSSMWYDIIENIYRSRGNPNRKRIESVCRKYTYNPGAQQVIKYLQKKGYEIILISGSLQMLVEIIAKENNIKYAKATNKFTFNKRGEYIGLNIDEADNIDETHKKLILLKEICKKIGISLSECACIGDGDNDLSLFEATGKGVTFRGSQIEEYAWKVIDNLQDIKKFL
ncbi:HAD family phosphatase [Candidatus Dojkabacteria bacterium]|uniref:phosphoserine phosphatase n=1 Tax=Candidatus Dojkabacteria bacterium TaxID=2099670 RepID=A0A955KV15_9BACT|nr:HAD family phosphatase [Candidatus Dojkabacteria bacterium]MCB9790996.1 HAD family phosphatase [Candidatus Nomurabacteria bacterium]